MGPLLSVRDLAVAFGGRSVVEGVGFDLGPGEVLGLVGESGSGKTTVALSLLGHRPPGARTMGEVRLDGQDLLALSPRVLRPWRGRRVAYVPQNPTTALNPARRVGDLLVEHLRAHGHAWDRHAARARAARALAEMGLPDPEGALRRYPHQLSGGQQQRVVLALAALCDPALLVLDEPTTGLDVTTQATVIAHLRRLRDERGVAMVYVTHDLALLAEIATRLAVLYAGRLVELGPAAAVFADPVHPYTRALLAARPRIGGVAAARPLRGLLRRDELPPGCPFAPRCDRAVAACHAAPQPLLPVGVGRLAACHRWAEPDPVAALAPPAPPARRAVAAAPVLEARDVSVRYRRGLLSFGGGGPPALHPLSFRVRAGEVLAVVGESGSGKSTLAKALAGLLPFAGAAVLSGEPLAPGLDRRPREALRRVQIVFQNPDAALNPRRRVRQILADAVGAFERLPTQDLARRLARAMAEVRLPEGHLARFPDELSGGERQRVAIARALIADPAVLICDEVLSALDVSVQAGVLDLLRELTATRGLAILFISHDLAVVHRVADRILVLYRGWHLADLPAAGLLDEPVHPYVRELLAALPGEVLAAPRPLAAPGGVAADGGCPFAPRCPDRLGAVCDRALPDWSGSGPARLRCHAAAHGPGEPARCTAKSDLGPVASGPTS